MKITKIIYLTFLLFRSLFGQSTPEVTSSKELYMQEENWFLLSKIYFKENTEITIDIKNLNNRTNIYKTHIFTLEKELYEKADITFALKIDKKDIDGSAFILYIHPYDLKNTTLTIKTFREKEEEHTHHCYILDEEKRERLKKDNILPIKSSEVKRRYFLGVDSVSTSIDIIQRVTTPALNESPIEPLDKETNTNEINSGGVNPSN